MRFWTVISIAATLIVTSGAIAFADVPMSGTFLAGRACPALQSFNKNTNPGDVKLRPQQTYRLISANNRPATHYLLEVPGATPDHRWVAVACGQILASGGAITTLPGPAPAAPAPAAPTPAARPAPAAKSAAPVHYVLSLSWEPAFCAGHRGKAECAAETASSFAASHFTLHGLWPDPREYCGAAPSDIAADKESRWDSLPAVQLASDTRARLVREMPGTQSLLERHEWLKHGTCSGASADTYFSRALSFLEAVNASPVRALLANNVGRDLSLDAVRSAFDQAFGAAAGERIRLSCPRVDGQRLIGEITVGLAGDVMGNTALPALIAASNPTNGGCDRGQVAATR